MADKQNEIIGYLSANATSGPSDADDVIETHGALVFLHADEALKIKRAVKYDYMDFSTLALRRKMLERELELNGPAVPGLYRDVVPLTREDDGGLRIGGSGEPLEWILRMARFPKDAELSVMADTQGIDGPLADELGCSIARYHRNAARRTVKGQNLIAEILDEIERVMGDMGEVLEAARISRFLTAARGALGAHADLLDQRAKDGWVRRCHGDLHLRNIIMWKGVPAPFDALEFDERLGTCDVLYDLAFLLMDLSHRGLDTVANRVMNAYLFDARADDHLDGLAAMPLFLSIRAAIRAMVDVQAAAFRSDRVLLLRDACNFMDQAIGFLTPREPALIAVGGLSGSGKSTLAREIAARIGRFPGAVLVRSDLERKAAFGVDPLERLPPEAYTPEVSRSVYAQMRAKAARALASGQSVILDSVHLSQQDRKNARQVAVDNRCAFCGLWLDASTGVRVSRVNRRTLDASDADSAVALGQTMPDTGQINWTILDADDDLEQLVRSALSVIYLSAK